MKGKESQSMPTSYDAFIHEVKQPSSSASELSLIASRTLSAQTVSFLPDVYVTVEVSGNQVSLL